MQYTSYDKSFSLYFRFYVEANEDGSENIRWTNLTIHDMKTVYKELKLLSVLDNVLDVHRSYLDKLTVGQLKNECAQLGLTNTGIKVHHSILSKYFMILTNEGFVYTCIKFNVNSFPEGFA